MKLFDSRTGITHDYSSRHDVVYSTVLLPDGADPAYENREFLWNQAEGAERRRDAQVCKDVVLALPKELDLQHHIELAKRFARIHFVDKGIPADIAIHDHGDGNPHAHILIATRRLEPHGFSKWKARDLNPGFARGRVIEQDYWGEQWRDFQNDYFIDHGIDLNVDLNHVIPERHEGRYTGHDEHYIHEENEIIKQARKEILLHDVDSFIAILSIEHSV